MKKFTLVTLIVLTILLVCAAPFILFFLLDVGWQINSIKKGIMVFSVFQAPYLGVIVGWVLYFMKRSKAALIVLCIAFLPCLVSYLLTLHPYNGVQKYEDNSVAMENHYKRGKLDGVSKEFDKQGHLEKEISYKNGVREGEERDYYPDGKLFSRTQWSNRKGFLNMENYVEYYHDGTTKKTVTTQKDGPSITKDFYPNGNVENDFEGGYHYGGSQGSWKNYYLDGTLKEEVSFDSQGQRVDKKYDDKGNVITKLNG